MKIKQIIESAGGTTSGAIASVASPIGVPQKRAGSLFKGKKTKKKFYEGKMKDLAYDIQHLDAGNFMKKYGQPKDYFTKKSNKLSVNETELSEQDLIIVPGMRKSKDTSFIPHEQDRRDHEVDMARSDLYAAAKDAMRIYKMIQNRSEDEGLMGWQQSYITLASDYLNSVADSLVHETTKQEGIKGGLAGAAVGAAVTKTPKGMATGYKLGSLAQDTIADMKEGAGVIAGGMSNFEEGRYYNPSDYERREQDAMDKERRDFKRREMEYELRGEEEAARRANEGPWYVRIDGKLVRDKNKDPYVFNTLEAARKAAQTMMKKDWNKGKQFSMTRSTTEGMSAAVKLQRAFDREKSKSDASRERGKEELEKARKEYDKKQGKYPEFGGEMVSESSESAADKIRARIGTSGMLQNMMRRHEDYMDALNQKALSRMSDEERYNAAKTQHEIDVLAHKLERMKKDDDDWKKTFDMLRDRINRYQWTTQQDVDPEKLEKISNIKYQPTKEGMERAVDSKGRTQQDWIKAVKQKYPDAKIIQSKMIDGPVHAVLPDGKKASWTKGGSDDIAEGKKHKCPECGGELVSEELMNEKKDACYYKVKSRYKVWPSAYASGALVKCRKKGSKNWGNKSK